MKSPLARLLLAVLVALVALGVAIFGWPRTGDWGWPSAPVTTGRAAIGGPFSLVDDHGDPVSDQDYRGRLLLVAFGYTSCPDVCQITLQTLSETLEDLGDRAARLQAVFITIDPDRDTVAVLAKHLSNFHPSLRGLTGSPEAIRKVAKAYHVYYKKAAAGGPTGYGMEHSSFIYLMDRDGNYLTHFGPRTEPAAMSQAILKALAT